MAYVLRSRYNLARYPLLKLSLQYGARVDEIKPIVRPVDAKVSVFPAPPLSSVSMFDRSRTVGVAAETVDTLKHKLATGTTPAAFYS